MLKILSIYSKIATIISSSFLGAGLKHRALNLTPEMLSVKREICHLQRAKQRALLVLWVCAGVNDAVHVQVEVVELHLVGVGFARVNGDLDTIALFGLEMQWAQGFQHK